MCLEFPGSPASPVCLECHVCPVSLPVCLECPVSPPVCQGASVWCPCLPAACPGCWQYRHDSGCQHHPCMHALARYGTYTQGHWREGMPVTLIFKMYGFMQLWARCIMMYHLHTRAYTRAFPSLSFPSLFIYPIQQTISEHMQMMCIMLHMHHAAHKQKHTCTRACVHTCSSSVR